LEKGIDGWQRIEGEGELTASLSVYLILLF